MHTRAPSCTRRCVDLHAYTCTRICTRIRTRIYTRTPDLSRLSFEELGEVRTSYTSEHHKEHWLCPPHPVDRSNEIHCAVWTQQHAAWTLQCAIWTLQCGVSTLSLSFREFAKPLQSSNVSFLPWSQEIRVKHLNSDPDPDPDPKKQNQNHTQGSH